MTESYQSLTLKYRPRSFAEVVGQRMTSAVLSKVVETKKVPSGLLFSGPSGTGKTTVARVFAEALDPDSDVLEIDAASHGGVQDIRNLIESLRYGHAGSYRVVIIDEAHSITPDGFNALLKTLEEPPAGTIFVLVTTEPNKVPDTVLSRLEEYSFLSVTPGEIAERLVFIAGQEGIQLPREIIADIAHRSRGNVRSAIQLLDKASKSGATSLQEFLDLLGEHDSAPALLQALLANMPQHLYATLDQQLMMVGHPRRIHDQLIELLRDLLVLRAGGSLQVTGDALRVRQELATKLEPERIFAASKLLWDLKTRVRGSENPRTSLELALILILEVFNRGKIVPTSAPVQASPQQPVEVEAPRALSISELQSMPRSS